MHEEVPQTIEGFRLERGRVYQSEEILAEDFGDVSAVVRAVRHLAGQKVYQPPSKPYLVIINPKSGPKKNAEQVYDTLVQPMLEQAGIDSVKRVTTHPKHAEEMMAGDDDIKLEDYGAVIAMGGDGIIHEILQGLRRKWERTQPAQSSSSSSSSTLHQAFRHVKLGVIGCGTSNGFAKSLVHASDVSSTPQKKNGQPPSPSSSCLLFGNNVSHSDSHITFSHMISFFKFL